MRWLRRFLSSGDPIVKLAAALSEAEAQMSRDILEDNGIPAMVKNMNFLTVTHEAGSFGNDHDLFVKQSDLERARELLSPQHEGEEQA
jgi:hypothetical protein